MFIPFEIYFNFYKLGVKILNNVSDFLFQCATLPPSTSSDFWLHQCVGFAWSKLACSEVAMTFKAFFSAKSKNTFWTIFWSSFLMCDSAAIYQLRFATASERRFCLAVVAKPCKIIAQQSRSWIFTLQFFEVKLRWFLTPSSANSAQLYSFCFPPLKQWGQPIYKISFL